MGKKSRSLRLGLTGSLAAGKSTVLKEFKRLGWKIASADDLVAEIYSDWGLKKEDLRKKLKTRASLLRWEKKIHPEVRKRLQKKFKDSSARWVVEIPLLFEGGLERIFDATIFVFAPLSERTKRARARGMSPALIRFLHSRQLSDEIKAGKANYIVHNDKKPVHLKKQIRLLHQLVQT